MDNVSNNRLSTQDIAPETLKLLRERDLRDFAPATLREWREMQGERGRRIFEPQLHPASLTAAFLVDICGFKHMPPPDKTRWCIAFTYRERVCAIADRKFGLDVWASGLEGVTDDESKEFLDGLVSKLDKVRTKAAREFFAPFAQSQLRLGRVTVFNHFHELRQTYRYFREELESSYATIPAKAHDLPIPLPLAFYSEGRKVGHYLQATVVSYFSFLEHRLLLAAPFRELPDDFDLDDFARASWKPKLKALGLPGSDPAASRALSDLSTLAVQHRNPFAHGGMDRGGSLFAVYHAGGGGAIPANLSAVRDRPYPRLLPSPSDIPTMLLDLDRVDDWLENGALRFGHRWAEGGLNVSFDAETRTRYRDATQSDNEFEDLMDEVARREDDWANADG
jgi:hypothetical protein